MTKFSNSAEMPEARPFFSLRMAATNCSRVDSSMYGCQGMSRCDGVDASSSSEDCVAAGRFKAVSKLLQYTPEKSVIPYKFPAISA